jgi:cytochrome c oxidase subunit 2
MIPRALPRRRALLLAVAGAATLLLALAPIASADWLTPESGGGSPNAEHIDTLYKIVLYIGIAIFLLVEGLLITSIIRFRRRRGGPEPAMVHGNTPLEVGWTVGAALIVAVIAAITFIFLPSIKNPPNSSANGLQQLAGVQVASLEKPKPPNGKALHINVVGQQYIWRFDYVGAQRLTEQRPVFAYYSMVVPTNTTVVLQINSADVAHSWWIPKLGGKADAIPGHNNYTWFKISKPGVYKGQCAELCGNNHADMLAEVRAVPPDQFEAWLRGQRAAILQSQQLLSQARKQGLGQ